jgi:hypothetical protein
MEIMGDNREGGEAAGGGSSQEDTWPGITGNKGDMDNTKDKATTGEHRVDIIKGKDTLGEHKGRKKVGWDLTTLGHWHLWLEGLGKKLDLKYFCWTVQLLPTWWMHQSFWKRKRL